MTGGGAWLAVSPAIQRLLDLVGAPVLVSPLLCDGDHADLGSMVLSRQVLLDARVIRVTSHQDSGLRYLLSKFPMPSHSRALNVSCLGCSL